MKFVYRLWQIISEVMGDRDYARYRAHVALRHPGQQPLDAGEFYVCRLRERYSRPSRCC